MFQMNRLLLAAALLATGSLSTVAQPLYAVVDYMRVAQDRSPDEYIATEKVWQKLHQRMVDLGTCRGWYVFRVENGGRNEFVTVRLYNSLDKMAQPWSEEHFKAALTAEEMKKVPETQKIRLLTRSELWSLEAGTIKADPVSPGYSVIHFMKPRMGKQDAYYNAERNAFQKYHQARVNKGAMEAWLFLGRMFPSGADAEYDFVTINVYTDKAAAAKPMPEPASVGLQLTDELSKQADEGLASRELVREEIWHPVLKAEPKP